MHSFVEFFRVGINTFHAHYIPDHNNAYTRSGNVVRIHIGHKDRQTVAVYYCMACQSHNFISLKNVFVTHLRRDFDEIGLSQRKKR